MDTPEILSRLRNREKIPKVEQQQQPEPTTQKKQRKDSEAKKKVTAQKKRSRRHSVQLGGDLSCSVAHLPSYGQAFAFCAIRLYQLQKLSHDVLSCLSPYLRHKLSAVSPDSSAFVTIIDDTVASLQRSEGEDLQIDFNAACTALEKLSLDSHDKTPVSLPSITLCRSPQHVLEEFQEKICHLLQLILPDVGMSFADSLSTNGDDLLALLRSVLRTNNNNTNSGKVAGLDATNKH